MEPSEDILRLLCEKMNISMSSLKNEEESQLDIKIGKWYELMKENTDQILLKDKYEEINKLFSSLQIANPAIKFEIFKIKYFIKTENYSAIDSHLTMLKKYRSTMSDELLFFFYYLSGMGYYVQNNFNKAEESLLISLRKIQTITQHSDTFDYELSDIYYYLSLCYGKLYKTHKTKEYALKSLQIADNLLDHLLQIKLYVILGINEGRTKSYENAIEYYQKAIKIAKAINNDNYTGIIHHNLGYLFSLQDKHQDAIVNYQKSLKYTSDLHTKRLVTTYFCLAKEFKKTKQIKEMEEVIKKGRALITGNEEYKHHFNILELSLNDSLYENRQYIREEVLPFFSKRNQWLYVMEYAEILASNLETNFQYKEAAKLYKMAFSAQKKLL